MCQELRKQEGAHICVARGKVVSPKTTHFPHESKGGREKEREEEQDGKCLEWKGAREEERVEETNRFDVGRKTGKKRKKKLQKQTVCGEGDGGKHELLWLLIAAVTLLISHWQKHEKKKNLNAAQPLPRGP